MTSLKSKHISVGGYNSPQPPVLMLYLHKIFKIVLQEIKSEYLEKLALHPVLKRTGLIDVRLPCTLVINSHVFFFFLIYLKKYIK